MLPALGHLKVRELHRGHIKAFLAQKRGQGYAKNSVRLMRAPLSAMLSDAVGDGIILANPAFQVGRHKTNRADRLTSAERVQKVRPMTWEQRDAFAGCLMLQLAAVAILLFGGSPRADPSGRRRANSARPTSPRESRRAGRTVVGTKPWHCRLGSAMLPAGAGPVSTQ